ncbi:MAG: hypothetical protein JWR19_2671 [Pedosphaera sp.]|nr:hypothetical protein [Pedosphaera sp.]
MAVEEGVHFGLDGGVHLDEGGPFAFEAFAGEFAGGVDAELGADGEFAGGMVEDVGGAAGENGVALGVGVGAEVKEDFAGVVDVDVGIDDDDVFGEHHLAHAPEAVHDFVGLHGVGFFDADEDEVVEDAFGGEGDVHDLGEVHLKDGEEEFDAGAAHIEVFHGRDADNGGGVNGVPAVGDGGDVKNGIIVGEGVVAGVVAEGAFHAEGFLGVDVAFDDEVGISRDFEVVGLAFDEFDGFFAEVTGEEKFVEAIGQGRGGAEGVNGVAAEEDGDGHALAGFVIAATVAGGDFLELPVHAGGVVVVNLDAIHAEVAVAGVGVAGDDARESDEPTAIEGPTLLDGEIQERGQEGGGRAQGGVNIRCGWPWVGAGGRGIELVDDILAGAGLDGFGFGVAEVEGSAEEFEGLAKAGGRFGFHEGAKFGGELVHGGDAETGGHALVGTKGINSEREGGDLAVDGRLLEQEGLTAAGFFHLAVGDFGDLELGGDGLGETGELPGLVERIEEIAERIERHIGKERVAERERHAIKSGDGEGGV